MGLEATRQALTRSNQQDFFRAGSLLVIVYISDENDCSDTTGTEGPTEGPVYALKDNGCEWNRNLEDSCLLPNPDATFGGLSARQVCVYGDRDTIASLSSELGVKCESDPTTGGLCKNLLVPRQTFYDFLVNKVAERNGYGTDLTGLNVAASNVIVATLINSDAGVRYASTEELDSNWCNESLSFATAAGTQGYRYELFARMFPEAHRIMLPICDNTDGQSANLSSPLHEIGTVIGNTINTVCSVSHPMQCEKKPTP